MSDELWENDEIQFARLLSEISACVNIDHNDWDQLKASMDLTKDQINELFERANKVWEKSKKDNCPPGKKNIILTIKRDQDPSSPREFSNLGTMVTWHRRYKLGDLQPKETPEEWRKANVPKGSVELPLFLMDHSGITMRTNKTMFQAADPQGWDWGKVGFIFCTPLQIKEAYDVKGDITPEIQKKVLTVLEDEVKQYDQYLRGEVWGYEYEVDGETDSCWGFYGDELKETGILEYLPPKIGKGLIEHAWENRQ